MVNHSKLSKNLREILLAVVAGEPDREQTNRLIAVFHALAEAFLAGKPTVGMLNSVHGLDSRDLAYDCIAELFQQHPAGQYVQLQSYFKGFSLGAAAEAEILAHCRRLVFSKVNHGIYRLYTEYDPSLAKILRNIKLAVQSLGQFSETDRFGEPCLFPSLCDALEHCSPFDPHDLECRFSPCVTGNEHIPELLSKFSLFLREQDEYCRIVPLVSVGLLFRSLYASKRQDLDPDQSLQEGLAAADVTAAIREASLKARKSLERKYSVKVGPEALAAYQQAVELEVRRKLLGSDSGDGSLYEQMKELLPGLTKETYARLHRNRVEYLLKLVYRGTVSSLKRDGFSG